MELPVDEAVTAAVPGPLPHHQEPLTTLQTISKGKRTKRSSRIASDEEEDRRSYDSVVTEEEQDLANCLILLARTEVAVGGKRKLADDVTGVCCYECKTCNKTFPSFQALGGHRTSHRRPKSNINNLETEKVSLCDFLPSSSSNCSVSLQRSTPQTTANNNSNVVIAKSSTLSNKAHRCSICGSEFPSGQALGGHMRRHRAAPIPVRPPCAGVMSSVGCGGGSSSEVGEVKTRSFLSLDLNLPAPEDGEISHQLGVQCQQNAAFLQQETLACHAGLPLLKSFNSVKT